jgi:hypothetical protein
MKKVILFLSLFFVSIISISQTNSHTTKVLSKFEIKKQNITAQLMEQDSALKYVFIMFKNAKYSHITDIKSISLFSKDDVDSFAKDLRECYSIYKTSDANKIWNNPNYIISLSVDPYRLVFIYDKSMLGYFSLFEKDAFKLCDWLTSLEL